MDVFIAKDYVSDNGFFFIIVKTLFITIIFIIILNKTNIEYF